MEIQTALLSVSNKDGIVSFARELANLGIRIISSGGTAKTLRENGVDVTAVSEYTGSPEILDGRVKTLHPRIHGGILARLPIQGHRDELQKQKIDPIGLVVVNLYPFVETISRVGVTFEEAVEQIDIGGPTLLRAAAKNHESVTVLVDPGDYNRVLAELKAGHSATRLETRRELALTAFRHTAAYDQAIATYLTNQVEESDGVPREKALNLTRVASLRYGENPHQLAGLYRDRNMSGEGLVGARQHHGKQLSFNNYLDMDAAWGLADEFDETCCVIVKHNNPCGAAIADDLSTAYQRALACDPVSAFGSVIAVNRSLDLATVELMKTLFVEVIVAPAFDEAALAGLKAKKNIRLVQMPAQPIDDGLDYRRILGGFVIQNRDSYYLKEEDLRVVTEKQPTPAQVTDLLFAWRVCKHVKSNAIVVARGGRTIGVGAGQMSRVDSVGLAQRKAVSDTTGCVLASDAFFPFRDGLDNAAETGVSAVIQPGGSIRDQEVIDAANEHGIAMVFTGIRHFRH